VKYQQGTIGRVFVAKVEHGDDLMQELKSLAIKENIRCAVVQIIGAMKSASVVTGPKECVVPPEPVWRSFEDGREILGMGTIFWDDSEPVLHLHSAIGKGDSCIMGCIRGETETYLILEVIVMEISGIDAFRGIDPQLGIKALQLK
jgi:predicted DNA-binding protein with PD1-like motif